MLCCWLRVPGKETAGPADDLWDHARIHRQLTEEQTSGSTFVLPIATLIETGNHISQAAANRFECASALSGHLLSATNAESPWVAFTEQGELWAADNLRRLAEAWPTLAAQRISIGDATIKDVAEYYARAGYEVEILTGDRGLKAYQPSVPASQPRRRN